MAVNLLVSTGATFLSTVPEPQFGWVRLASCPGIFIPGAADCVNSDDANGFGSNIEILGSQEPTQVAGRVARFAYTSLPKEANGGAILDFTIKTTSRRNGGNVGGQWSTFVRDTLTLNETGGPTRAPGAPGGNGLATFFDNYPLDPNGDVWTAAVVNRMEVGVVNGPAIGSGVHVYFLGPTVTWIGAGAAQDVPGV